MTIPTLPAFANAIAGVFPELESRCFAVSEVDPFNDKTNRPTLPVAVVALVTENATQAANGGGNTMLSPDVIVQFIFEPVKYTTTDGRDTAFFSFYDYEAVRDTMLVLTRDWRSPRGSGMSYKSLDVTSDEFAVYITMRFVGSEKWCDPNTSETAPAMVLNAGNLIGRVLQPSVKVCCDPCPEPTDPCAAARDRNPQGLNVTQGPPYAWDT